MASSIAPPNDRHVVDGEPTWGVTDIITQAGCGADFTMVPPRVLDAAIARGNAVHDASQLIDEDDLDRATVDPAIQGYVDAYDRFRADTGYEPIVCEVDLFCPTYRFAGRPDKIGWLGTRRILPDVKTALSMHPAPLLLQLAAYEHLANVTWPNERIDGVYLFQPRANGTYRFRRYDTARAWRTFVYCLRYVRNEAAEWEIAEIGHWVSDGRAVAQGLAS